MSNRAITFYPNYLHYNSSDPESGTNFSPSVEPSIVTETYTSSGGETTGPAYDLVDGKANTKITIDTGTGTTSWSIDFDLSSAMQNITTIIIANHNLKTADGRVIARKAGVNQTPLTNNIEGVYTLDQTYHGFVCFDVDQSSGDYFIPAEDGLSIFKISSGSNTAWELAFDFVTAAWDTDVTIGEIGFSASFTPDIRPNLITREDLFFGTELQATKGGQNYGHGSHGERKGFSLTYEYMTLSQKQSMELVYKTTKGGRHPMWVDLGEGSEPIIYYCRFVPDSWNVQELTGGAYMISFDLITEV